VVGNVPAPVNSCPQSGWGHAGGIPVMPGLICGCLFVFGVGKRQTRLAVHPCTGSSIDRRLCSAAVHAIHVTAKRASSGMCSICLLCPRCSAAELLAVCNLTALTRLLHSACTWARPASMAAGNEHDDGDARHGHAFSHGRCGSMLHAVPCFCCCSDAAKGHCDWELGVENRQ
jgi:hypothetical protein